MSLWGRLFFLFKYSGILNKGIFLFKGTQMLYKSSLISGIAGILLGISGGWLHAKESVRPWDIAIVGSGVAGLSAAIYGGRARMNTIVFAGEAPGGQLIGSSYVENIPGVPKQPGYITVNDIRQQAEEFGAQIDDRTIERIEKDELNDLFILHTTSGDKVPTRSVIIATGSTSRRLGVSGETEFWGRGVFTCAVCDCAYASDRHVVIVGGGDTAIEHALQLAAYAKHITFFVRSGHMRAAARMQNKLASLSNISVYYQRQITNIFGNDSGITHIEYYDSELKKTDIFPCEALFLAIGHIPNTQLCASLIDLTPTGYIKLKGRHQHTSVRGIFAAGDVADEIYRQGGTAAGDGIKAAFDAISYLREQ